MYKNDPRTPRSKIPMKCARCKRSFLAFRSTAKYCGDVCRSADFKVQKNYRGRTEALQQYGNKCSSCGKEEEGMTIYVRKDPSTGDKAPFCSSCNSSMSRKMFLKRVPNPGKHYAKRIAAQKREEISL